MIGKFRAFFAFLFVSAPLAAQKLKPCASEGLYGYCDSAGIVKIERKFTRALHFRDRLAPVLADDGYWWFIDKRGFLMFNSRKWADQFPPEPVRGLYHIEYQDAYDGKVSEYYNRSGLPVKVADVIPAGDDTLSYSLFSAEKALEAAASIAASKEKNNCTGFVRSVFAPFGIHLPYLPKDYAARGREISRKELRPGDLVFFGGPAGFEKNIHVIGLVSVVKEADFEFFHACPSGQAESIKSSNPLYRDRFLFARRVFN
jgi:hypothetical protein